MYDESGDHLVTCFMRYANQARILHWQTKKYARHNAYGMLYDALNSTMDTFIETHMGKYGRVKAGAPIELKNMDDMSISEFMDELVDYLISMTNMYDPKVDSDLLNIRDDLLGTVNKVKYLLTLE